MKRRRRLEELVCPERRRIDGTDVGEWWSEGERNSVGRLEYVETSHAACGSSVREKRPCMVRKVGSTGQEENCSRALHGRLY